MAAFIGTGKLLISKGDNFVPIAEITDDDLSFTIEIEMTLEDRRNFLVWWLMFNALATASRILD